MRIDAARWPTSSIGRCEQVHEGSVTEDSPDHQSLFVLGNTVPTVPRVPTSSTRKLIDRVGSRHKERPRTRSRLALPSPAATSPPPTDILHPSPPASTSSPADSPASSPSRRRLHLGGPGLRECFRPLPRGDNLGRRDGVHGLRGEERREVVREGGAGREGRKVRLAVSLLLRAVRGG